MRAGVITAIFVCLAGCDIPASQSRSLNASLDEIERRVAALEEENESLRREVGKCSELKSNVGTLTWKTERVDESIEELDARINATYYYAQGLEAQIEEMNEATNQIQEKATVNEASIANHGAIVEGFSGILDVVRLDEAGNVVIEGANLHVRSGEQQAEEPNGKGNVVIGYDRLWGWCSNNTGECLDDQDCIAGATCGMRTEKTGSHNLVIGSRHSYSSFDSLLVGVGNASHAPGCFVAGTRNTAVGEYSSVAGGAGNTTEEWNSAILGGRGNVADGYDSTVVGGLGNTASAMYATVSGGAENSAEGQSSMVCGGAARTADQDGQVIAGACFCPEPL